MGADSKTITENGSLKTRRFRVSDLFKPVLRPEKMFREQKRCNKTKARRENVKNKNDDYRRQRQAKQRATLDPGMVLLMIDSNGRGCTTRRRAPRIVCCALTPRGDRASHVFYHDAERPEAWYDGGRTSWLNRCFYDGAP